MMRIFSKIMFAFLVLVTNSSMAEKRCLVSSNNRNFDRDNFLTDAWLPDINLWVGEYPYLLRPAFEEICYIYLQ